MNEEQLQQLLRRLNDPAVAPFDGQSIRRLARRRQMLRRGALAGCACIAALFFVLIATHSRNIPLIANHGSGGSPGDGPLPASSAPVLDARALVMIEAQEQVDRRRLVALTRSLGPVDLAEERAQAARTMVLLAQRRAESAGREEAVELYHRAIAMFPDTDSAGLARQALAKLDRQN